MRKTSLVLGASLGCAAATLGAACFNSSNDTPSSADAAADATYPPDQGGEDGPSAADAMPPGTDGAPSADGGDASPGTDGASGGGGPYLYVPPNGGLDIYVYRIDPATGTLAGGTTAGPVGKTPGERTALAHPNGKFYFAIDATGGNLSGRIDVYRIDGATGSLSPVRSADGGTYSFVLPNADFQWMVTDPQGRFLYVTDGYAGTNGGNSQIVTLAVDSTTGELSLAGTTPMDPFAFESGPVGIALDPDAGCLYTAGYDFAVARVKLDPSGIPVPVDAGGATGVSGTASIGECTQVALGPNGTAYVICAANAGQPGRGLYAYTFDAGAGTLSMQTPTATDPYFYPNAVAPHPNGNFVYVATTAGEVVTFGVPADGGVATQVAVSDGGLRITSLQFDRTGARLYAGGGNSPSHIHLFNVDPTTGALSLADSVDGGVAAGPYSTSNLVIVPNAP
jgi:6-phosphogluconolactonase (cycloisomerase 2 family)